MRVLLLTAELAPVFSLGRVGEVAAGLARGLKTLGHDVRVITPRFSFISARKHALRDIARLGNISLEFNSQPVVVRGKSYCLMPARVSVYYLEASPYYSHTVYDRDPASGISFSERFTFFAYSALHIVRELSWVPEVIHCCGVATLMVPLLIRGLPELASYFSNTRLILHLPDGDRSPQWGTFSPSSLGLYLGGSQQEQPSLDVMREALKAADFYLANGESGDNLPSPLINQMGWFEGVDVSLSFPPSAGALDKGITSDELTDLKSRYRQRLAICTGVSQVANRPLGLIWLTGSKLEQFFTYKQWRTEWEGLDLEWVVVADRSQESQIRNSGLLEELSAALMVFNDEESILHLALASAEVVWVPSLTTGAHPHPYMAVRYGAIPILGVSSSRLTPLPTYNLETGEGLAFSYPASQWEALPQIWRTASQVINEPQILRNLQVRAIKTDCSWTHAARLWTTIYQDICSQRSSQSPPTL